ncbi:hypothetical protein [Stenotrophomonas sp. 24(2023)]|uniref:hypothetical protein n=1 Tax=Stenotrophomonas sp. 24(2023) TaxID=3068324 RepID=UPI0027E0E4B8|nr:hypothetical protein [Stenotrophomonas sp. 24(2023)]WMJ67582.1 hypothetical protein Q9R17_10120 [Stenotrophomonas sp. 24(2023)]
MHNESPIIPCRAEPRTAESAAQAPTPPGMAGLQHQQRQRARRTALWVGGVALLVYVGFILSGVVGR